MARSLWLCFGVILTVALVVSLEVAAIEGGDEPETAGGSERAKGLTGGDVGGNGGVGGDGSTDDRGDRVMEEGEHSGVGEDVTSTEDTFYEFSELRAPRLCQASIFKAFASSSWQGHMEGGSNQHMDEEEEAADSDEADSHYVESPKDEEAEELEILIGCLAKRQCIF